MIKCMSSARSYIHCYLDGTSITQADVTDDRKTYRHNVFDWKAVKDRSARRPKQFSLKRRREPQLIQSESWLQRRAHRFGFKLYFEWYDWKCTYVNNNNKILL